jgi:thioredoxin-like negative regulator of GroEL
VRQEALKHADACPTFQPHELSQGDSPWPPSPSTRTTSSPTFSRLATELSGKVKVAKINIDENPELAAQYGVRSIPTLMLFKDGEVADMKVGAAPKTALSAWIGSAVA